ncbi:MAG: hypothetical protein ACYDA8_19925 [Deferrisomatales bacterium]
MNGRRWATLVAVTAVAAFLGGAVGEPLLFPPAQAAKGPAVEKVVAAEQFLLVDAQGGIQARLGVNGEGLATVYWMAKGQESMLVLGQVSLPAAPQPAAGSKPAAGPKPAASPTSPASPTVPAAKDPVRPAPPAGGAAKPAR